MKVNWILQIFVIHLEKGFGQSLKEEMVVGPLCPGVQLKKTWAFPKTKPWLPVDIGFRNLAVDKQLNNSESNLNFFKN